MYYERLLLLNTLKDFFILIDLIFQNFPVHFQFCIAVLFLFLKFQLKILLDDKANFWWQILHSFFLITSHSSSEVLTIGQRKAQPNLNFCHCTKSLGTQFWWTTWQATKKWPLQKKNIREREIYPVMKKAWKLKRLKS